jgi:hypothetical protein
LLGLIDTAAFLAALGGVFGCKVGAEFLACGLPAAIDDVNVAFLFVRNGCAFTAATK